MLTNVNMSISWFQVRDAAEGGNCDVPKAYKAALQKEAPRLVYSKMSYGFQKGEMSTTLTLGLPGEPEGGLRFEGYWEISHQETL